MSQSKIVCSAVVISIFIQAFAFSAQAKKYYGPGTSMIDVTNKTQKHFDRDNDGYLSIVENSYYKTQQRFGYPLVKKSKQIPYDTDGDGMLESGEWRLYSRDKSAGTLKKPTKDQVKYSKKKYKKINEQINELVKNTISY